MNIDRAILFLLLLGFCSQYANETYISQQEHIGSRGKNFINIGVIINMASWHGKVVDSCITMAVSDFYNDNNQYNTRISVHVRDSRGDSLHSIAAALDLLENVQVHALIVPVISNERFFLASLADKANVPLLSFSAISSLDEHPYYLHVGGDETTEFHAIAALTESFKWKACVILHEGTTQVRLTLNKILQENNVSVLYHAQISPSTTSDQIVEELRLVNKKKTSIIILHLSPSLASQVFVGANMLGMMTKGFAWIVTSKTMNLLSIHDSSVHELMQGVIGLRSYFSSSSKLQNITLRWKTESNMETRGLSVYGVWAYDAIWALALAIERGGIKSYHNGIRCNMLDSSCLKVSDDGQALLAQILSSKFTGLAGVFELENRTLIHETYKIVNVIGNGERTVGFWNLSSGLTTEVYQSNKLSSRSTGLETIIWPGISLTTPANQLVHISINSLRVGIPLGTRRPEFVSWRHDQETNVTVATGYCIDVFRAALDRLQYNISLEFFPFNGTYNELVYQVYVQNYDVAVGDISILANRSEYVDFTCPYTDLGVGMVAKLDETDPWFFTRPLDAGLWLLCASLFIVLGLTVWLIERGDDGEFNQFYTLFWFAVSTLVFAHREKLEKNHSRFVVGIWIFIVFILTSSYTANLSSILTVQRFKLTKSGYIGSANPLVESYVVYNLNFDDNRLKPYHTAEDYAEALQKGTKKGGVDAIVDEIPYIKIFLAKYPNEYTIVQTIMTSNGFGFAFPKGSSLAPAVSRAIDALREEKRLLEMERQWVTKQSTMLSEDSQPPSVETLKIHDFSRLFIMSCISQVLALYLFFSAGINGWLFRMYQKLKQWWSIVYELRCTTLATQAFLYLQGRVSAHPVAEVELATLPIA